MALTNKVKTNIALKKILGVAHTSVNREAAAEPIKSGIQNDTNAVFGYIPPAYPDSRMWATSLDKIGEGGRIAVQKVTFTIDDLGGTNYANNTSDGDGDTANTATHAYGLVLSGSYSGSTAALELADNAHFVTLGGRPTIPTSILSASFSSSLRSAYSSKFDSDPFTGYKQVYKSSGSLQLVPPQYGASTDTYELKLYKANGDEYGAISSAGTTQDFSVDYYSGVVYVQDPDSSGRQDISKAVGYIYVGDYATQRLDETLAEGVASVLEIGVTASVDSNFNYGYGNVAVPSGPPLQGQGFRWFIKNPREQFPIFGKEMVFANGILQDSGSNNDYIIFRSSSMDETITTVEFTYDLPENSKVKVTYIPRTV
tara:strand:- start:58 stop:1167 length:1110 start_codon:yes stop_codon:yes gene_type:complete